MYGLKPVPSELASCLWSSCNATGVEFSSVINLGANRLTIGPVMPAGGKKGTAMKRIFRAIIFSVVVLSLSRMAVGQAGASNEQRPSSLNVEMFQAIEKGDFATVLQLLDKGAHIDAQGKGGVTALIAASAMGKPDVVKQLLDKGANLEIQDSRGDTALNYAVMISNLDEVKLLLAKGANVNIQEESGLSPLMLSVVSGSPDIVKLLLDHGANTEARDKNGFTALMAASGGGLVDLMTLLLDRGANI